MPQIVPDLLALPILATDEVVVHRGARSFVTPAQAAVAIGPSSIAQFVALDTPVALDNLRLEARLTGGQGFRVGTVAGTMLANISALTTYATDSVFGSNRAGVTLTTTMTHPFVWLGQTDADALTGHVHDRTSNRFYEFTIMTNVAPTLSFVQIIRTL